MQMLLCLVGVTTIVSLMLEKDLARFVPYKGIASQYMTEEKQRSVEFVSFPIPGGVLSTANTLDGDVQ